MDLINLPIVDNDLSLEEALSMMRQKGSGGVISRFDTAPQIIETEQIVEALRHRTAITVGDLAPRTRSIKAADVAESAMPGPDMRTPEDEGLRRRVIEALDREQADFAVVQRMTDRARIFVPDGELSQRLRQAEAIWRCPEDNTHYWSTSELGPGNTCPKDHAICERL